MEEVGCLCYNGTGGRKMVLLNSLRSILSNRNKAEEKDDAVW
jgi:hypothetical protein